MPDNINPTYYKDGWSNGAEVIDITENLNFNRGNAVKYIARAGKKNDAFEDLTKAKWYIERELSLLGTKPDETSQETEATESEQLKYAVDDWRILPVDTVFTDCDGDKYVRVVDGTIDDYKNKSKGAIWVNDNRAASLIVDYTEEYAPYTVVSRG